MSDILKIGLKSSIGWLELGSYDADPTDTDANRRGICFVGTTLKQWSGTSWVSVGSGGATTSWDELYDIDKVLTIDEDSLTLSLTHATNNGLTLTGAGGSAGHCIQITNSGSGKDINGTSNTWSATKAGVIDAVSVTSDSLTTGDASSTGVVTSSGNYNLQLKTGNATTGNIELIDAADGDVDITLNGTGAVNINGTTTHNDALVVAAGDVTVTLGDFALTDDQNAESVTIINNTVTTLGVASSTGMVEIESTSLTTGTLLNLQLTEGTLEGGYYLRAWDATGGVAVFSVGEDGNAVIAGTAAGTNAIVCTLGDIYLSDSDTSIIESENGTATLLTVDNKLGVIASGHAVLKVDAGGVVDAAGYGILATFSGSAAAGATVIGVIPDAGGVGIKIAAGGVVTQRALDIDADPTSHDVAYIHSDAVIQSDKALLNLNSAGAIASGANVLRVDVAGTPASGAVYTEFDFAGLTDTFENVGVHIDATSKKVQALKINAAPLAGSTILATSTGLLAANKATCELVSNVAACNADSAVLRVEQTATDGVATCVALKQDDIDIPFITFESTIGTGDAIEAVGAKTLTTTHFVKVDIEGVGVRYIETGTIA